MWLSLSPAIFFFIASSKCWQFSSFPPFPLDDVGQVCPTHFAGWLLSYYSAHLVSTPKPLFSLSRVSHPDPQVYVWMSEVVSSIKVCTQTNIMSVSLKLSSHVQGQSQTLHLLVLHQPNPQHQPSQTQRPTRSVWMTHSYAQCTDTTPTTAGSTSLTEMGTGTAGTPHPPPQLWLENTSSTSVHYMLKSSEFLKFSGVLTRDGEPFNRPKMPTIPLEVDISKITDEETPD